tara:strand:+ start:1926 stop:2123 length:198 start_codon:yes stop_codon:yes gene_type:complete
MVKIVLEKDEKIEKQKFILKHFIVEASEKDMLKLNAFSSTLIDVAKDMGLNAYEDDVQHLIGSDY